MSTSCPFTCADMEDRDALLASYDLMTEAKLSSLLGVSQKAIRNRPHGKLPRFTKLGRERLFYISATKEMLERNVQND
jgi:hypothetical protein